MKAKKINFKSESGFTLMELMVVIGVLAILIAILLPQFTGYTAQAQALSAAAEAKNVLTAGYSYYVSSTSTGGGSNYKPDVAKARMQKAAKTDDTNTDRVVDASNSTAATYTTKKGNLTFTVSMDLTKGSFNKSKSDTVPKMQCAEEGSGNEVCKALSDEGSLNLQ